jgi:hypothetical protein
MATNMCLALGTSDCYPASRGAGQVVEEGWQACAGPFLQRAYCIILASFHSPEIPSFVKSQIGMRVPLVPHLPSLLPVDASIFFVTKNSQSKLIHLHDLTHVEHLLLDSAMNVLKIELLHCVSGTWGKPHIHSLQGPHRSSRSPFCLIRMETTDLAILFLFLQVSLLSQLREA